jgi:lipid-A-disaccharide synthase
VTARVFIVAGEPSGDALGADLMAALRSRRGDLVFAGAGGAKMAAQGLESAIDIAPLSVFGLIEGLKAYNKVVDAVEHVAAAAVAFKPDVAVLIDSWGFTLRVARALKIALPQLKIVKYVGPQVWATRPGRAKTLAATIDHLICINEFEKPFYEPFGLPVTVSGAPALARSQKGDGAAFRARYKIGSRDVLLLLPGSRRAEIARVSPTLERVAQQLCADRPNLFVVCVVAPSVAPFVRERAQAWPFAHVLVEDEAQKDDAFAAATLALAASGTVTTEVALQGAPVIVGYKIGWVTWALARLFLMRTRYITLLNVAADDEIAPEFLQTRFTVRKIVAAAAKLLDNPDMRGRQIAAQDNALNSMGRGGRPPAEIAADVVLGYLSK